MKQEIIRKTRKRLAAIGVCTSMLFSLCACGQTDSPQETSAVTPTPETEDTKEATPQIETTQTEAPQPEEDQAITPPEEDNGFSKEANILINMGLVPEEITQDPEAHIKWSQMAAMISNVVGYCDESLTEQWEEVAAIALNKEEVIQVDGGAAVIYEAACVLGLGADNRAYWHQVNTAYNDFIPFLDYEDIFPNFHQESPVEAVMGQHTGWDYLVGAKFYALGLSSADDPTPFLGLPKGEYDFVAPLTHEKAITAAYRLLLAYGDKHNGSYAITETDWQDPLLAGAKDTKDSILNSETAITYSGEFILGETYNGTAYYVSNSGDDGNDGLSPESAWASLDKVANEKLSFGDAVFFNRGDIWYGSLIMQAGVSYSAYGSGAKPIITGSPLNAADPAAWSFYGETVDGGKIWKYHEDLTDVGVMLFNGEELIGKKVYPAWNGTDYVDRHEETFSIEADLRGNLMFCSILSLSGRLPIAVAESNPEGMLYLRCDEGNPGDVFDKIEMAVIGQATTTAMKGYNAIDNINFRVYAGSGADCCSHDNIIYQNCEISWCGGAVKDYNLNSQNSILTNISGGGMLMFGSHVTARNNYVHDCENKGIAIVINGGYGDVGGNSHASLERVDVHVENNVIERCGSSIYMMMEFIAPGSAVKFEDIYVDGNYVINTGYGWRVHNMYMQGNDVGTYGSHCEAVAINNIEPTGDVVLSNNLFYEAAGPLVFYYGKDFRYSATPTMISNTYVQDENHVFFMKKDETAEKYTSIVTLNQLEQLETCVQNDIEDSSGTVIIQ